MFLSRVMLDWAVARNPYEIHRALWELFPGEPREPRRVQEESRNGFLYRVESAPTGRAAVILAQSRRRPEEGAARVRLHGVKEFDPQPVAGQKLAFLLTANPVKTITDDENASPDDSTPRKCRVPLLREEEQTAWLARKLEGAAQVSAVMTRRLEPLYFRKGKVGKIVPVQFEGLLEVENSEKLLHCLQNGIGPAKGFGCGLLLVRRAG